MSASRGTLQLLLRSRGLAAFTCQSAGLALIFLLQIGIARLLGTAHFGIYAYVTAWVTGLGIAARFGLDTAVLRDAGIYSSRNEWSEFRSLVRTASQWTALIGTAIAVICAAGAHLSVPAESAELKLTFWIGAALVPFSAVAAVRQSALLGLGRAWAALAPEYIVRPMVVGVVLLLVVVLLGFYASAHLVMSAALSAVILTTILGQFFLIRSLPDAPIVPLEAHRIRALKQSGLSFLWSNGTGQLLYQIDTILVGTLVNPTSAGKYYVAKQLALLASLGLIALQITAAPRMAALHAAGDRGSLQKLLTDVARRGSMFALLYALFAAIAGRQILGLFGPEFVEAYPLLMVLVVGQLIGVAGGPIGQAAAMGGLQTIAGAIYVLATILYIGASSLVIPGFGSLGAAIVVAVTTFIWIFALNALLWHRTGVLAAIVHLRRGSPS